MDDTSPNTDNAPQMPADSPGSASDAGPGIDAGSNSVPQAASNPVLSSKQMPAPSLAAPPASFDPMANGPQPPALEPRLAAVAAIADPHLRQHVEANVRLQTQRQVMAFTEAQRQAKAQAKQVIDQGGDLSTIPAKLMLQIDTPGRQALHNYVLAHGNPATDPVTYYGLKNQALDDPAAFQAIDLSDHMARLKPADYTELQQLQTSLNNNQPPADLPLQQAYKANTDHMLQGMGLPTEITPPPGGDTANGNVSDPQALQQALKFRHAADLQQAANQIATGRQLTPVEHRKLLEEVSFQHLQPSTDPQRPAAALAGAATTADVASLGAQGIDTEAAVALGRALLSRLGPLGPVGGFAAGMWPKPTAGPALDEAPPVHDVPDPENGVARSEDSDGPAGAEINEARGHDKRSKSQIRAAEAAAKANAAGGASAPPPDPNDDDEPIFKRPNDDLKFNDQIDLKRFTKRIVLDENPRLKTLEDPDSGYRIQKDKAGHGWTGPRVWKLLDRFGERVGSLDKDGRYIGD